MSVTDDGGDFWETTGASKTFTHPIDDALLCEYLPSAVFADAPLLDYGCGYGRITADLSARGYGRVTGVDVSRALVERGRRENPGARLVHAAAPPLPFADGHFAGGVLFAVLTSVPTGDTQQRIAGELARLIRPGGVLYVSDVPLQDDERNIARYQRDAARFGTYGVFEVSPGGGTFRHHRPEWLRTLLADHGFTVAAERRDTVPTLDGHTVRRIQLIAHRDGTAR